MSGPGEDTVAAVPNPAGAPAAGRPLLREARRRIPPVRLLWILLALLAGYGIDFLGGGLGLASTIVLPVVAATSDLVFQRIRFDSVRFPDAAIATGLFLALIFPPVVPLAGAVATAIGAVTVKHVLRYRGRPWLNPAAAGIVLGIVAFGFAPAWWGAIDENLLIATGLLLFAWNWRSWRLPTTFVASYALFAVLQRVLAARIAGAVIVPKVLLLATLDPAILFFALFMVPEPRSAPSFRRAEPLYAAVVAAGAALLPIALPTLSVFLALFSGTLVAMGLRRRPSGAPRTSFWQPGRAAPRGGGSRASTPRWSLPQRAGAGIAVFLFVAWMAALTYNPLSSPAPLLATSPGGVATGGGGSGVSTSACTTDNSSIPSGTLQSLHRALGPSVILSYSTRTGVVVFYDPVNAVTVTETDLYEDFGYAEFNGDDYTTAGCTP